MPPSNESLFSDTSISYESAAPGLRTWYDNLSKQTGLSMKNVVICYWAMRHATGKTQYQRHNDLFYNHTPENRKLLLELADRVANGEYIPDLKLK